MSRTSSPFPFDDPKMWRRLLARVHPDAGGSEELFVFAQALREEVSSKPRLISNPLDDLISRLWREHADRPRPKARPKDRNAPEGRSNARVSFETTLSFEELTARAMGIAEGLGKPYDRIVSLLEGCALPDPEGDPKLLDEARFGAAYWRLADVGYALGLDGRGRAGLYRIARDTPLSGYHALRLLEKVQELVRENPDLASEIREKAPCPED